MSKRVFLVHGWDGAPDNHWFPWLSWELKARGFAVDALTMPNAAHPKVSEWIVALTDAVGRPDRDTYFVGHSLGCIAIARYLGTLPPRARVGGCVFVAGFSGDINIPEITEFYSLPFDPAAARRHCDKFVCIFSDNDHAVPFSRSLDFAKQLGAKTILEKGKDHFCTDDGVSALPSAFAAVLSLAKS